MRFDEKDQSMSTHHWKPFKDICLDSPFDLSALLLNTIFSDVSGDEDCLSLTASTAPSKSYEEGNYMVGVFICFQKE